MPAGTIDLTNGSNKVSGSGTSFISELKAGDFMYVNVGGAPYTIVTSSVVSDVEITLTEAFTGPTSTGLSWNSVPALLQMAITQKVINDFAQVARGRILDFENWQGIYSDEPSVTVTRPDRTQYTGPSWGHIAKVVGAVEDPLTNLVPLSRQYMTLAAAQADIANIPDGAATFVRSSDDESLAIEYINTGGVLTETGRKMPSQVAIEEVRTNIQQDPLSQSLTIFTDELGFSHSQIREDGAFETPMLTLDENQITSGNISVTQDGNFDDDQLMISDALGFSIPSSSSDAGGGVDPGEVTVDLPPQSAAYGLLSKMRSALDDVCVIINSDSTGITQDTDPVSGVFKKWTRKLAEFLAGNYPAYTVLYYSWASGAYGSPVTLQVGTAGKTLHFYNAAVAGTQPLYLMGHYFEAAYVPRLADLLIFNHGHNTDYNVTTGIQAGMALAAVYQILLRHPAAGGIMVSQNPLRDSDQGANRSNGARQAAIAAGFSLIDAYQLFMNAGKPTDWYLDNIHPNATGDAKIFDLVKNLFVWPSTPAKYTQGLINGANLIPNGEFVTWTEGGAAPDGWTLTGCTADKDTVNFESGDYGLKLTSTGTGDANAACALPSGLVRRLRGQTITLACRTYVPAANTRSNAGSVSINGISASRVYGVTSPNGRGGFVWKAAVITVPLTATTLSVLAILDTSGGVSGNTCTFDRLTLVVGNIPQDFF
ncbi:UNVERIFIED_ORG: hypothetical protein M2402_000863 [Rahnella aquatilis]